MVTESFGGKGVFDGRQIWEVVEATEGGGEPLEFGLVAADEEAALGGSGIGRGVQGGVDFEMFEGFVVDGGAGVVDADESESGGGELVFDVADGASLGEEE